MSDLNLYLDVTNRRLVKGQYNAEPMALPKVFFESTINVSLMLLRANPDGGIATPFTVVDNTGMSLTVAVGSFSGTTGTKLASQNSWTIASNKFTGTLNLNTSQMVSAMTGNDTISKLFEIEWGSNKDTYQTPITISGEVITAGSPDPNDYTNTEFADAMEARLDDSNSIDFQRAGDQISAHVKRKTGGRVEEHSTGIYIDDELNEIVSTTLQNGDSKTLSADAKYRIITAVYNMNGSTAAGSASLSLSTTNRSEGDIAKVHFNASSISYDVAVDVDSTANLTFTTDNTNPFSLYAEFFYDGAAWALVTAHWEDGTLSGGDFTPTYPSTTTGFNETKEQQVSVSAAGETHLTFTEGKSGHAAFISAAAGSSSYTHTLVLKRPTTANEGAPAWDVRVSLAASDNPTIELYDEGSTDSSGDDILLATFTGTSKRIKTDYARVIWDATNSQWLVFDSSAGDANGMQTIFVPARGMTPQTTNGAAQGSTETATNAVMLESLDYDASTNEFAQFEVVMPKAWNAGTVCARFHWTAASGSGDVIFGVKAFSIENNEAIDSTWGTGVTVTDTLLNTDRLHVTNWTSAVTISGAAEPSLTYFNVYRLAADGSDTLSADAKLIGVEVLYQTEAGNDD